MDEKSRNQDQHSGVKHVFLGPAEDEGRSLSKDELKERWRKASRPVVTPERKKPIMIALGNAHI